MSEWEEKWLEAERRGLALEISVCVSTARSLTAPNYREIRPTAARCEILSVLDILRRFQAALKMAGDFNSG